MTELIALADSLAPNEGYNTTSLASVRLLRSSTDLHDVPVLYRPGAVFVLQGRKEGVLGHEHFRYDAEHYLAVALPVSFRMLSRASAAEPLLAVYLDFDMTLVAQLAEQLAALQVVEAEPARSLVSSTMEPSLRDALLRLLQALADPVELAVLGPALVRELHYRVLTGNQAAAMLGALATSGPSSAIARTIHALRTNYAQDTSVGELASAAGMSPPVFHARFRELTGTTPLQYLKSIRLHEARLRLAGGECTVGEAAAAVGTSAFLSLVGNFGVCLVARRPRKRPGCGGIWARFWGRATDSRCCRSHVYARVLGLMHFVSNAFARRLLSR